MADQITIFTDILRITPVIEEEKNIELCFSKIKVSFYSFNKVILMKLNICL